MNQQKCAIIDIQNPFYCPGLPAAVYLQALRQTLVLGVAYQSNSLFYTFARMLDRSGFIDSEREFAEFIYDSENDWIVGINPGDRERDELKQHQHIGRTPVRHTALTPSPDVTIAMEGFTLSEYPPNLQSTVVNQQRAKRKRDSSSPTSGSSNGIGGGQPPAKYAKSVLLANDSSFELQVGHEKLDFNATGSPTLLAQALANSRNGNNHLLNAFFGEVSLIEVLTRVVVLLPGIRLGERLGQIPDLTVQKVADFLSENGYMNQSVLELFCHTDVSSLSLGTSLSDEDGLNICGQDVIGLFGKANSFQHLTELFFSGSRVEDFNLVHIHHLPKLSCLYLDNTGIGNEAVYLLVPLKRTLKRISLATNPDINSESVPAMLLLANLEFLSILDTNVDITGLRVLARVILEEERTIDIEIPYACEYYVDNLHSKYLLDPQPPLVTSPEACDSLSVTALKKNLAAHAENNPSIVASGTRKEMVSRLREILTTRKLDLIVAQMLLGA